MGVIDLLNQRLDYRNIANTELAMTSSQNTKVVNHVTAIQTFKQNNYLDDPLFLGYRPFFHYTDSSGLLAPENFTDSALAYLKRVGENARYVALKQFMATLQKVNIDMPYMFQTIDGLIAAKNNFNIPIVGEEHGNIIVFGMLESINMRIQGLIQTYKTIVYDNNRHVYVLPRNLRQFSMSVCVYATGAYDVDTEQEGQEIPNTKVEDTGYVKPADSLTSYNHIMFEFSQCEFDITNSGQEFFESVNNQEITMAGTSISVSYKRVRESGLFKSLMGNTKISGQSLSILSSIKKVQSGDKLVNFLLDAAAPIKQDLAKLKERFTTVEGLNQTFTQMYGSAQKYLEDNAASFLSNQVNRLFLGNIYDSTNDDIVALAASRGAENAIINLGRNRGVNLGGLDAVLNNGGNRPSL